MSDDERDDLQLGGEMRLEIDAFRHGRTGFALRQPHSYKPQEEPHRRRTAETREGSAGCGAWIRGITSGEATRVS
jgi:hypothetical protein